MSELTQNTEPKGVRTNQKPICSEHEGTVSRGPVTNSASRARQAPAWERIGVTRPPISYRNNHQRRFNADMDDLQISFSKFKKGIKHRLGKSKRKGDEPEAGGREESIDSSSSFPQPEHRVSTGGGREQGGDGPNAGDETVGASAVADENRPGWTSTASSSAKLVLRAVRDSADAFGPLKSVAGGLCFILENCEVRCLP